MHIKKRKNYKKISHIQNELKVKKSNKKKLLKIIKLIKNLSADLKMDKIQTLKKM